MIRINRFPLNTRMSQLFKCVIMLVILCLEEKIKTIVGCLRIDCVHLVTRARQRIRISQALPRLFTLRMLCILQVWGFLRDAETRKSYAIIIKKLSFFVLLVYLASPFTDKTFVGLETRIREWISATDCSVHRHSSVLQKKQQHE